jgi:release factor glutamine methyltransferase
VATLRTRIHASREQLVSAGIDASEAALDAELLARQALGWDRATLVARLADPAPPGFDVTFAPLLERRRRREPMAYILGVQEFWGRDFKVAPGVLIPRPETELLIEETLAWAREQDGAPLQIADVGTGSGCLAITIALEVRGAEVYATDISPAALAIAGENAQRLGATIRLHQGLLLADVPAPLDLIVSNPPYVTQAEYEVLQPEVRAFEPETALVGGGDGLAVIRELIGVAATTLRPGGRLLMEIGYGQAEMVGQLVRANERLELRQIMNDLQGIPRAVVAARGPGDVTSSE